MKDTDLKKTQAVLEICTRGKRIAVAVSGGKDSMCLLDLVLNRPYALKENVLVINVDHGIRKETSERDSRFVAEYCRRRGVECVCYKTDIPALCKESGRSEETEAREYRRKVFAEVCVKRRVEAVLTAHHKSDNAETVLMNIMRGSGISGLCGIKTFNDLIYDGKTVGELLRPMLSHTRAEIDEYAAAHNIEYVEDETNEDTDYSRNFIRKKVLPLLNERFCAETALCALAERAREDDGFINSYVDEKRIERTVGGYKIDSGAFFEETPIASRYALLLLKKMTDDYTQDSVKSIIDCAHLQSGGKREISARLTAVNEYGSVALYENYPSINYDYELSSDSFDFGCFTAKIETAEIDLKSVKAAAVGEKDGLSRTLYADADKIPLGARIRNRAVADTFKPFGGGEKKLKYFLINSKIPQRLRDFLPLLCDGKKTLAVFGAEISPEIAVDENTKRIIKLTLEKGGSLWKE